MGIDDPADVLAFLPFLVAYALSEEPSLISRRLLKRVKALAGIRSKNGRLIFKTDWRRRLLCAGIDPDTFKVVDEFRWSHAWDQLRTEMRFTEKRQTHLVIKRATPIDMPPRAYPIPSRETPEPEETVADVGVRKAVSSFIEAKKSGFKQSL